MPCAAKRDIPPVRESWQRGSDVHRGPAAGLLTNSGVGGGIAAGAPSGVAGAGELDERLQQPGDAFEAGRLVLPVAQIDEPLVGAQAQRAGVLLDQFDEARPGWRSGCRAT